MTTGGGYLSRGDSTNAIVAYKKALERSPESVDAWVNLANSYLLAGQATQALEAASRALALDANDAGAYYVRGLAYMRLNQPEEAVKAFQQSQAIDPTVTALNFQLGLAYERAGQLDTAIQEFETIVQFEPEHPSAHYQLSRLYQRANRADDATRALETHQGLLAKNPNPPSGATAYERCKYTEPRVAFQLAQPDPRGVPVRFENATERAFAGRAGSYRGPLGVIDYDHDGRNSLFVSEQGVPLAR
jgi:tetratricopeptide (TPR) repeat protein